MTLGEDGIRRLAQRRWQGHRAQRRRRDDGLDGVIKEDHLGLAAIYVQAKPSVLEFVLMVGFP